MAMQWIEKKSRDKKSIKNRITISINDKKNKSILSIGFPADKLKDVTKTPYICVGYDFGKKRIGLKEGTSRHFKVGGSDSTTRKYIRVNVAYLAKLGFPANEVDSFVGEYKLVPEIDRSWSLEKV